MGIKPGTILRQVRNLLQYRHKEIRLSASGQFSTSTKWVWRTWVKIALIVAIATEHAMDLSTELKIFLWLVVAFVFLQSYLTKRPRSDVDDIDRPAPRF